MIDADGVLGHLRAVNLLKMRGHFAGSQPPSRQAQHDVVDPVQPPLTLLDDAGLEAAVAVAGDLDLDRPDLGQHRLRAGPVARVPAVPPGPSCFS